MPAHIRATLACGVATAAGMLMGLSPAQAQLADPIQIETGLIQGAPARDPAITAFKGVPYAAPPIGALRWRPPARPVAWTGVRKADAFGAVCPQLQNTDGQPMSEDCLFANIWTGAASSKERRPVLVWVHGGGFGAESGSAPKLDGEELARKGVVLVTFNYRLGPLGFLATPELSQESGHNASGNYGLMDDIALLQWVKRNIAAFGGDPEKVTFFGHSAGGGTVNFLSISPMAKGLYSQALAESQVRWPKDLELRYLSSSWREKSKAEKDGAVYVETLGAKSLAELRAMPWKALLLETPNMEVEVQTGSTARPPLFRPVIDGYVLPHTFSQAFALKTQNPVTYIAGNNRDEGGAAPEGVWSKLRAPGAPRPAITRGSPRQIVTLADFQAAARRKFGPMADEFLTLYPATNDDEAARQNNAAIHDNSQISTYLWARQWTRDTGKPMYTYWWAHALPGPEHDTRGAYHGSEIPYVFNSLHKIDLPWTDEDRRVADAMSSYWANYAKSGGPNGPGLPHWPRFDAQTPQVMVLGDGAGPAAIASGAKYDFWTRFFATNDAW